MAHTPGPWEARNGEVTTERIEGRSFRRIAAVQDYGIGSLKEVDDANARLIAAAPELLAALEECITEDGARAMADESRNAAHIARRRLDEINRICRAAITKAKGEV